MSDHNIDVHPVFFKEIKSRVNRLGHVIDQLDILVYHYKRLEDPLEKLVMISFELRQDYTLLKEACKKATLHR
jgi:hypothetical protein